MQRVSGVFSVYTWNWQTKAAFAYFNVFELSRTNTKRVILTYKLLRVIYRIRGAYIKCKICKSGLGLPVQAARWRYSKDNNCLL